MSEAGAAPLQVISLGAGVQSTTLALMAAHGELTPMPDAAVFADTGDEPRAVYEHLEWLRSGNVLPFPVIVTRRLFTISGALRASAEAARSGEFLYGQKGAPPLFVMKPDGSERGMLLRQCTENWKLGPIEGAAARLVQERLGADARARMRAGEPLVTQWIGISADEAHRMKPSRRKWITNRFPLAMEHRMSRGDCLAWLERHGYPRAPRSACVFCPYKSNAEWRLLRDSDPHGWQRAIEIDRTIRGGLTGMTRTRRAFVHADRVPLEAVDLDTAEDRGQLGLWGEECTGLCGV